MTHAAFGSLRVFVGCCKTISRSAVTAEAAGSSTVVPAIPQIIENSENVSPFPGC